MTSSTESDSIKTNDSTSLSEFQANNEEFRQIFVNVTQSVSEWKELNLSQEDFTFTRLSGNSNACYRVKLRDDVANCLVEPRTVLYRKYLQTVVDKSVEQAIFLAKAEEMSGPRLFSQTEHYRVEGFFEGRPITLWEMRNPSIFCKYSELICQFHFSKLA